MADMGLGTSLLCGLPPPRGINLGQDNSKGNQYGTDPRRGRQDMQQDCSQEPPPTGGVKARTLNPKDQDKEQK